jgi:dephospho-CoA kinase
MQNEKAFQKKIFGTIGLNGSGKDEAIKHLKKRYGIPFISVGDMVRQIAAQKCILPTRANLHNISSEYIQQFGNDYFMKLVIRKIEDNRWEKAGVTGIRTPEDVKVLRDYYEDCFVLFHVYVSDPYIRYERTRKRGEQRDPKTFQEFLEQDMAEERLFRIRGATKFADFSLNNEGSRDDLHHNLDAIITVKGLLR